MKQKKIIINSKIENVKQSNYIVMKMIIIIRNSLTFCISSKVNTTNMKVVQIQRIYRCHKIDLLRKQFIVKLLLAFIWVTLLLTLFFFTFYNWMCANIFVRINKQNEMMTFDGETNFAGCFLLFNFVDWFSVESMIRVTLWTRGSGKLVISLSIDGEYWLDGSSSTRASMSQNQINRVYWQLGMFMDSTY